MQFLLRPPGMKRVPYHLAFCGQWEHVQSGGNKHGFIASKLFLSFFVHNRMPEKCVHRQEQQMEKTIIEEAENAKCWYDFLAYKTVKQHLSAKEEKDIREFVEKKAYLPLCEAWKKQQFPIGFPVKKIVNKEGTGKKRIVYSFEGDEGIFLKFVAFHLFRYDEVFCDNCYAFRRGFGVRDAIRRICSDIRAEKSYCLKADISNYFNSIDVELLLPGLSFIEESDPLLYQLLEHILREKRVWQNGELIAENHGAMAGTPFSPFLANIYLMDTDWFFKNQGVLYLRYSDDILLFADNMEELRERQQQLYSRLSALGLTVNPEKVNIYAPGEPLEFLGFCYRNGEIDLSDNTKRKVKAKMKRKARALRRWQHKKQLSGEKAAIGFIRAMNRKFYGSMKEDPERDEFTWNRWFFPNLTVDTGLKEIDAYMQQYIRYTVTGRHYKGNYRIRYETLKEWGYRNLVHEYYEWRKSD